MRQVLVQKSSTQLFLRDGNEWTAEAAEARNFGTSLNALAHCLQHGIRDAQVVIRFGSSGTPDVIVPVSTYAGNEGASPP